MLALGGGKVSPATFDPDPVVLPAPAPAVDCVVVVVELILEFSQART